MNPNHAIYSSNATVSSQCKCGALGCRCKNCQVNQEEGDCVRGVTCYAQGFASWFSGSVFLLSSKLECHKRLLLELSSHMQMRMNKSSSTTATTISMFMLLNSVLKSSANSSKASGYAGASTLKFNKLSVLSLVMECDRQC
ncbi:hypothetical protein M9H77_16115 [Catharanthus roseus]|uniref:Uncharacterized protein n=1 Tax=Catharanthus roseus TaxID=4058 RepID=A0ACC0B0C4_CATRO|nr:hypothetical protein M9H77_16115 [Catharanthus roseus]